MKIDTLFRDVPHLLEDRDLREVHPGFETPSTARFWSSRIADTLQQTRRTRANHVLALKLWKIGDKLDRCRSGHRCGSELCQVCKRLLRLWLASEVLPILWLEKALEEPIFRVTIIPIQLQRPFGMLHTANVEDALENLRKQFFRSKLRSARILGFVDYSANVDAERRWDSHMQPHYHFLVAGASEADIHAALHRFYRADATVRVPVQIKPVTDPVMALTYIYRGYFDRRITYLNDKGEYDTSKRELRPAQQRELALFLGNATIGSRMFMRNLRVEGNKFVRRTGLGSKGSLPYFF